MTESPLRDAATVIATGVGGAEGARGAAAALASAGAEADRATLYVEFGGRAPRPTLLASAAARRLEERLAAHLPRLRPAARGQVCHLSVPEGVEGIEPSAAAVAAARGALAVLHAAPGMLGPLLGEECGLPVSGALLRADIREDRALLGLVVRGLLARGLAVGVVKERLGWVAERRALFGVLPPGAQGGLPTPVLRRFPVLPPAVEPAPVRGLRSAGVGGPAGSGIEW